MAANFYGSPVRGDESEDESHLEEDDSHSEAVEPRRPTCCCKTTCSRKSGKRPGCPCKDDGLKCVATCICGKKKQGQVVQRCANGKPQSANEPHEAEATASDGRHLTMEQELEKAKNEVQDLVKELPVETLQKLIVELAVMGSGSLDFVKDLVTITRNPDVELSRPTALPWCKCGVCTDMGKPDENKCCGRKICITSYYMYRKLCLDADVLKLNITARCDLRADPMDYSMNAFRKAAYRQFALWKFGHLGRGNRRILPSCVLTTIRSFYPSPTGQYMGFKKH
eukprot:Seg3914.1 transcript_id=Seg3914.1/GoldUCD/mRNA.D3Y31 product="hypothetical protein" protein_id=Seg3914.1/GoldUCD/D3Y31